MFRVLVVCTGNSARSQLAEALLATRGRGRIQAESAGSSPAMIVHPLAVEALREIGIPWSGSPKPVDALASEPWDLVITVCDHAREACPIFPEARLQVHWGIEDPSGVRGTEAERLEAFRKTRDLLARRVDQLLALPLERLGESELRGELEHIRDTVA